MSQINDEKTMTIAPSAPRINVNEEYEIGYLYGTPGPDSNFKRSRCALENRKTCPLSGSYDNRSGTSLFADVGTPSAEVSSCDVSSEIEQVKPHRSSIRPICGRLFFSIAFCSAAVLSALLPGLLPGADIPTAQYDSFRTSWNSSEPYLNRSNVNAALYAVYRIRELVQGYRRERSADSRSGEAGHGERLVQQQRSIICHCGMAARLGVRNAVLP